MRPVPETIWVLVDAEVRRRQRLELLGMTHELAPVVLRHPAREHPGPARTRCRRTRRDRSARGSRRTAPAGCRRLLVTEVVQQAPAAARRRGTGGPAAAFRRRSHVELAAVPPVGAGPLDVLLVGVEAVVGQWLRQAIEVVGRAAPDVDDHLARLDLRGVEAAGSGACLLPRPSAARRRAGRGREGPSWTASGVTTCFLRCVRAKSGTTLTLTFTPLTETGVLGLVGGAGGGRITTARQAGRAGETASEREVEVPGVVEDEDHARWTTPGRWQQGHAEHLVEERQGCPG